MSKPLSLNEIRTRAAQFVIEWRGSPGDERQDAQSFVRDILSVFGITETRAALYEKRAQRTSTGTQGYIDTLTKQTVNTAQMNPTPSFHAPPSLVGATNKHILPSKEM